MDMTEVDATNPGDSAPLPHEPAPPRRRRWRWVVVVLLGTLGLLVALAPTALSWGLGASIITEALSDPRHGSVHVGGAQLSWFGPQTLSQIEIQDETGQVILTIDSLQSDLSLAAALFGNRHLGHTEVQGVRGKIRVDESGQVDLLHAASKKNPSPGPTMVAESLAVEGVLRDVRLDVHIDGQALALSAETLELDLPSIQEALRFKGDLLFEHKGHRGALKAEGRFEQLFAADGRVQSEAVKPSFEVHGKGMAAEALDALLGAGGRCREALGGPLDLDLQWDGQAEMAQLICSAQSPHLQARVHLAMTPKKFNLSKASSVRLVLTPKLFADLQPDERLKLDAPVALALDAQALSGSFRESKVNLGSLAAQIRLKAEDAVALNDRAAGSVTLSNLVASLDTESLGGSVNLSLKADVKRDDRDGALDVHGQLQGLLDAGGQLSFEALHANASARVEGIPVALLELVAGHKDGQWAAILGDRIDRLTVTASGSSAQQLNVSASLASTHLALGADRPLKVQLEGQRFRLMAPTSLRWKAANAASKLAQSLPSNWTLATEGTWVARIDAAELVLDENNQLVPDQSRCAMTLRGGDLRLGGFYGDRRYRLVSPAVELGGASFEKLSVKLKTEGVFSRPGLGGELFARRAAINLTGMVGLDSAWVPRATLELVSESKMLDLQLPLTFKDQTLSLAEGRRAKIAYELTPLFLGRLQTDALPKGWPMIDGLTPTVLSISKLNVPLENFDVKNIHVVGAVHLKFDERKDPYALWVGREAKCDFALNPTGPGQTQWQATLDGPLAHVSLGGQWGGKRLTAQGKGTATISSEALRAWKILKPGAPGLAEPVTVVLDLKPSHHEPDVGLDGAKVDLAVSAEKMRWSSKGNLGGAELNNLQLTALLGGSPQTLSVNLSGMAAVKGQAKPGPLKVVAVAQHPLAWSADDPEERQKFSMAFTELSLKGLPASLAQTFGLPPAITSALGPTLNHQGRGRLTSLDPLRGELEIELKSGEVSAEASIVVDEKSIRQRKPTRLALPITPEAFASLMEPSPPANKKSPNEAKPRNIVLMEPAMLRVELDSLLLPPLEKDKAFDASLAKIEGVLRVDQMKLGVVTQNKTTKPAATKPFVLRQVQCRLEGQGVRTPLRLALTAELQYGLDPKAKLGALDATASIEGLFAGDEKPATPSIAFEIKAKRVPVRAVDDLLGYGGVVVAAAGEGADLTLQGQLQQVREIVAGDAAPPDIQYQGPVRLSLSADHARTRLRGDLINGQMRIAEQVVLELDVTEPLGRGVLARAHPMFETLKPRAKPMRLIIPHENLQIPITDFAIEKVVIPDATIELGQLAFQKKGFWHALLSVLIASGFGGEAVAGEQLDAWFTPMRFSIRNGRLVYKRRLDVLISRTLEMSTWGQIDLKNNTLELTLAVSNRTLKQVLRNIGLGADFRMPITSNWQGDFQRAGTALATLVAQDRLVSSQDGIAKQLAAAVLGGLVRKMLVGGGAKPPPSVNPLPWDAGPKPPQ